MSKIRLSVMSFCVLAAMLLGACAPGATATTAPTLAAPEAPTMAAVSETPVVTPESAATVVAPTPTAVPVTSGEVKGILPKGDGKLNLWIAGNGPDVQKAFDDVIANFEKDNPGFKVTVQYIGWGDISTKLTTAFAGNVGPDVFMHGVAASAGFMSKSQILDLTPYFQGMPDKDDFYPAMIKAGTVDGKLAMMPAEVTNYMLIYRKDLYTAAGLDPNSPPKTWEELIANAQKLTKSDAKGITVAGLQLPYNDNADCEMAFAPILRTYGGDLMNADGKSVAFNSDAGKQALQLYVDMVQEQKVSSIIDLPGDPNASLLGRGAAAQIISGQFDLADIKANMPDIYKEIGVALPPVGPSGKPVTMSSFSGFMIGKDAKNPADAWTLLSYLETPASLTKIDSASLFLGPRQSMATADYVTADPLFKAFSDGLQYGQGNPNVPAWIPIRNALGEQIIAALNGKVTVADALKAAETTSNEAISKQ
ncbi:MAG: ABC transporter substrate-binding protein [Anaerolineaceae bacterium]|nr:ABC transporter substrate-binding protein [Anaerolineaceae bacterium]